MTITTRKLHHYNQPSSPIVRYSFIGLVLGFVLTALMQQPAQVGGPIDQAQNASQPMSSSTYNCLPYPVKHVEG